MSCHALVEDYARVTTDDLRRMLGGRKKLKAADSVVLHLAAADVPVMLTKCASNLGAGRYYTLLVCPSCSRRVAALRILPGGTGAACGACVRRAGARYASQMS
jgi:hypothetical protein